MKICKTCKKEKPEDYFYRKNGTSPYRHGSCKECYNSMVTLKAHAKKIIAAEHFGNVCYDCGKSFNPIFYDFHHLDSDQKDMSWNKLRYKTMKRIWAELNKCIMLCSHCHRLRHYGNGPVISIDEAKALIFKQHTRKPRNCRSTVE